MRRDHEIGIHAEELAGRARRTPNADRLAPRPLAPQGSLGGLAVALSLVAALAGAARPTAAGASDCAGSAAVEDGRAELCGLTFVTGTSAARMPVHLPAPVTVDLARSFWGIYADDPAPKHVEIEGEGDYVGFALFQVMPERDGAGLVVGLMRDEFAFTTFPENNYTWWDFGGPPGGPTVPRTVSLPAGDYDLYLLAEGSRVDVTLRLDGLAGTTSLEPAIPVDFDARLLEPRLIAPGANTMTAGAFGELTSDGVNFVAVIDEEAVHGASARGICRYRMQPEPEATAYGPTCPSLNGDGQERLSTKASASIGSAGGRVVDYQKISAGAHGLGAWFSGAPAATKTAVMVFWLSLGD